MFKMIFTAIFLCAGTVGLAQTNAAINCYLGGIRSMDSQHETVITFVNNAMREVDILWVNYDGVEEYYNTLQPGDSYAQPTFFGHPWVMYRAESNICKGIVVPFTKEIRFEIN